MEKSKCSSKIAFLGRGEKKRESAICLQMCMLEKRGKKKIYKKQMKLLHLAKPISSRTGRRRGEGKWELRLVLPQLIVLTK